jgi:hypothetical protein
MQGREKTATSNRYRYSGRFNPDQPPGGSTTPFGDSCPPPKPMGAKRDH